LRQNYASNMDFDEMAECNFVAKSLILSPAHVQN
jgi:hypothetical protein